MPGEPGASRSINWPGLPLLPWGAWVRRNPDAVVINARRAHAATRPDGFPVRYLGTITGWTATMRNLAAAVPEDAVSTDGAALHAGAPDGRSRHSGPVVRCRGRPAEDQVRELAQLPVRVYGTKTLFNVEERGQFPGIRRRWGVEFFRVDSDPHAVPVLQL